ncbi:hypothetical protein [Convivina intestini]|nr:hypothetical protein [Convivina intestini]
MFAIITIVAIIKTFFGSYIKIILNNLPKIFSRITYVTIIIIFSIGLSFIFAYFVKYFGTLPDGFSIKNLMTPSILLPTTIGCTTIFLSYISFKKSLLNSNISEFNNLFNTLIQKSENLDAVIFKIPHKSKGIINIAGTLLDRSLLLISSPKHPYTIQNKTTFFNNPKNDYIEDDNFLNQLTEILIFIDNTFEDKNYSYNKNRCIRQIKNNLSHTTMMYIYLYITYSDKWIKLAKLIKKMDLFGFDCSKLPKESDTFYSENEYGLVIRNFFTKKALT